MKTIKSPYITIYNNGNIFPIYIVSSVGSVMAYLSYKLFDISWLAACIPLVPISPVVFNRNKVEVNKALGYIRNYTVYLGFIKLGKKIPLEKFKYVSAIPLVESIQKNSTGRMTTTTSVETEYFTCVKLFGERLQGNLLVTQFYERDKAERLAKELAESLNLIYFDYDPKIARQVIRGEISL